jgi:hypothetical protein
MQELFNEVAMLDDAIDAVIGDMARTDSIKRQERLRHYLTQLRADRRVLVARLPKEAA